MHWSNNLIEKALKLYKSNKSFEEISSKLDRTKRAIQLN